VIWVTDLIQLYSRPIRACLEYSEIDIEEELNLWNHIFTTFFDTTIPQKFNKKKDVGLMESHPENYEINVLHVQLSISKWIK
jgi:hypothetical protein